jgi:hypothetical protein
MYKTKAKSQKKPFRTLSTSAELEVSVFVSWLFEQLPAIKTPPRNPEWKSKNEK